LYWLSGGIIISLFGFFAIYKYHKKLIVVFIAGLFIDILLQMIYVFFISDRTNTPVVATVIQLLTITLKIMYTYFVYKFWKSLPSDMDNSFAPFNPKFQQKKEKSGSDDSDEFDV